MTKIHSHRNQGDHDADDMLFQVRDAEGKDVFLNVEDVSALLRVHMRSRTVFDWFARATPFLAIPLTVLAYMALSSGGNGGGLPNDWPVNWIAGVASLIGGGLAGAVLLKSMGLRRQADGLERDLDELDTLLESDKTE